MRKLHWQFWLIEERAAIVDLKSKEAVTQAWHGHFLSSLARLKPMLALTLGRRHECDGWNCPALAYSPQDSDEESKVCRGSVLCGKA